MSSEKQFEFTKESIDTYLKELANFCDLEFVFQVFFNVPQLLLIIRHGLLRQFSHFTVKPEFHDGVIHLHVNKIPLSLTVSDQEKGVNVYRT